MYCSYPIQAGWAPPPTFGLNIETVDATQAPRRGRKGFLLIQWYFLGKAEQDPKQEQKKFENKGETGFGVCDLGMPLRLSQCVAFELSTHQIRETLRSLPGLPSYGERGEEGGMELESCQKSNIKNRACLWITGYYINNIHYVKINLKFKFSGNFWYNLEYVITL